VGTGILNVTTWAIVPIKPLNRSKSRLSPILNGQQREALSRKMLEMTLTTLKQVQGISGILAISRDNKALTLARSFNIQTVQESGTPELNDALTRATQAVSSWNASSVLILASDIPLMTVQDVEGMLALANHGGKVVVIATDRREEGTNALLVRPPGLIPYQYGTGSFRKHMEGAQKAGVEVKVFRSPTMSLDVDMPEDLIAYREILGKRKSNELAWLSSL
jgi:2-phospho-L-lactate guanylyltransferase